MTCLCSVEGRVLYAVVAAPRAPTAANALPRPSFTWIGNMHGDETANKELLLRLAAGLCRGELVGVGASDCDWRPRASAGPYTRLAHEVAAAAFGRQKALTSRTATL